MDRSILITGTSTGIGYDAARILIEKGYRVFGSVRRTADGDRVQSELGDFFVPLVFDVTDADAIAQAASAVRDTLRGDTLSGLVNNAGIAVAGPLEHIDIDRFRHQLEVNVVGVVAVTQAFLPLMTRPGGRIVNISSVSGRIAFPFFGPYAASKFALEALSESWRRELMIRGIDVIVIGPGSVKTPIWEKAAESDVAEKFAGTIYQNSIDRLGRTVERSAAGGMPVEMVSQKIYEALTINRPKTRYALPATWLRDWVIPLYAPRRWIDRIIQRSLNLFPPG